MGTWYQLKPNKNKMNSSLKFLHKHRVPMHVYQEKGLIFVNFSKRHQSLVRCMRQQYECQVTECNSPPANGANRRKGKKMEKTPFADTTTHGPPERALLRANGNSAGINPQKARTGQTQQPTPSESDVADAMQNPETVLSEESL